jgi:hypothetical protein
MCLHNLQTQTVTLILFLYLLPVDVPIFTHLFFLLVLCLFPFSLVPVLHPNIQFGATLLFVWYFYHIIAQGYDFQLPLFLF